MWLTVLGSTDLEDVIFKNFQHLKMLSSNIIPLNIGNF